MLLSYKKRLPRIILASRASSKTKIHYKAKPRRHLNEASMRDLFHNANCAAKLQSICILNHIILNFVQVELSEVEVCAR